MNKANLVTVMVFMAFIFGLTIADILNEPSEISITERRKLAVFPEISFETIIDGRFTKDYASYLQDQVVFRDEFRALKSRV